jgi:predicted peptidase
MGANLRRHMARHALVTVLLLVACAVAAGVQDLPRRVIVDDVKCVADPTQSYSLYLPAAYSADRRWPVLIGFHPGGRGRAIVEKYRAAAIARVVRGGHDVAVLLGSSRCRG